MILISSLVVGSVYACGNTAPPGIFRLSDSMGYDVILTDNGPDLKPGSTNIAPKVMKEKIIPEAVSPPTKTTYTKKKTKSKKKDIAKKTGIKGIKVISRKKGIIKIEVPFKTYGIKDFVKRGKDFSLYSCYTGEKVVRKKQLLTMLNNNRKMRYWRRILKRLNPKKYRYLVKEQQKSKRKTQKIVDKFYNSPVKKFSRNTNKLFAAARRMPYNSRRGGSVEQRTAAHARKMDAYKKAIAKKNGFADLIKAMQKKIIKYMKKLINKSKYKDKHVGKYVRWYSLRRCQETNKAIAKKRTKFFNNKLLYSAFMRRRSGKPICSCDFPRNFNPKNPLKDVKCITNHLNKHTHLKNVCNFKVDNRLRPRAIVGNR